MTKYRIWGDVWWYGHTLMGWREVVIQYGEKEGEESPSYLALFNGAIEGKFLKEILDASEYSQLQRVRGN